MMRQYSQPFRARGRRRGFTLIEILVTVVLLGIAGALVIPAMGSVGVIRVQGALRSVVADLTFAQSDAVAFQERRAVMFDVQENEYRVVAVPGDVLAPETNTLYNPGSGGDLYIVSLSDPRFGDTSLMSADFDEQPNVVFDSLGGPLLDASSDAPGSGGAIVVQGSGQTFEIRVEAFTGRITIERTAP